MKLWGSAAVVGFICAAAAGAYFLVPVQPSLSLPQKERVEKIVTGALDDPYSARLEFAGWATIPEFGADGQPIALDGKSHGPGENFKVKMVSTRWYCGTVNARNRFGAYTGRARFIANPDSRMSFMGTDHPSGQADYYVAQSCDLLLKRVLNWNASDTH